MTLPALPPDLLPYRIVGPDGDELTFNGPSDSNGVEWIMRGLDGWETPDVRTDATPRPGQHGSFTGTYFYDGRSLTATGYLHSPTGIDDLRTARDRLLAAVDTPTDFCGVFVDETPARQVLAKRAGKAGIVMRGKYLLEFDIALVCPDPRRYAQALTTITLAASATASTTPGGNFRDGTPIALAVTPASGAGEVHETTSGSIFKVTGTRAVSFNSLKKTVTFVDDGTPAWAAVETSNDLFLDLKPGVSYSFQTVHGTAVVHYRDAWV